MTLEELRSELALIGYKDLEHTPIKKGDGRMYSFDDGLTVVGALIIDEQVEWMVILGYITTPTNPAVILELLFIAAGNYAKAQEWKFQQPRAE